MLKKTKKTSKIIKKPLRKVKDTHQKLVDQFYRTKHALTTLGNMIQGTCKEKKPCTSKKK